MVLNDNIQQMSNTKFQTVLLIDDNEVDNFINQKILKQVAFAKNIVAMESGISALEYLKDNFQKPGNLPEVIFLDIRMPIMDGFGFLDEYDKFPEVLKGKVKIIMISSTLDKNEVKEARSNRYIFDFLSKPLDVEELTRLL